MQLCWGGLVLLGGFPAVEWGLPSCHSVPCVFQMPQVLVKLKKYPQGDKVRLGGLCVGAGLHGEIFPVPDGEGGDRGRWACASSVVS